MTEKDFFERVRLLLERIRPKLEELADGYAELLEADPVTKRVKVKLVGGRLH